VDVNREELAWAAGFFDGEGCACSPREDGIGSSPVLTLSQIDSFVLRRFKEAVGGIGLLYGPYTSGRRPNQKPQWKWQSQSFETTQAVIALLWNFLSPVKRSQCATIFVRSTNKARKAIANRGWEFCKQGHLLSATRIFAPDGVSLGCGVCRRDRVRKWHKKQKERR